MNPYIYHIYLLTYCIGDENDCLYDAPKVKSFEFTDLTEATTAFNKYLGSHLKEISFKDLVRLQKDNHDQKFIKVASGHRGKKTFSIFLERKIK